MTKVFVYGSLKRGFYNHIVLGESTLLKEDTIQGFDMYDLGSYPAIVEGEGKITGEIYEVPDDETFQALDRLEGYPLFYNRKEVETGTGETVWVYYHEEVPTYGTKMPVGTWGVPAEI